MERMTRASSSIQITVKATCQFATNFCPGNQEQAKTMGHGTEEISTKDEASIHIQERGEIYLFYRPKVNRDEAHSEDDVQKLYIVLKPDSGDRAVEQKQSAPTHDEDEEEEEGKKGGHGAEEVKIEEKQLMRMIVMGRKRLPDPSRDKGRPYWGFVELVSTNLQHIKAALRPEEYETSTRGHRVKPGARALGEGIYRILSHTSAQGKRSTSSSSRTHTHLLYKLEFPTPETQREPQEQLNIKPEASFLIQIKNPHPPAGDKQGFRGIQGKGRAAFPATLQGRFGRRRYVPADPVDLLNYEGCELLLISASDDIKGELGLELKTDMELQECSSSDGSDDDEGCCSDLVHTFGDDGISTVPLFQGAWA